MEERTRQPFEGVTNIIRFNQHFYVAAIAIAITLLIAIYFVSGYAKLILLLLLSGIFISTLLSLAVSFYVYDISGLYALTWLPSINESGHSHLVNINAGFDETSHLLAKKYPGAQLSVFDFYNAERHTELSIERARERYAPYPETLSISTTRLPLEDESADTIFVIFSAHEIRERQERIAFFAELKNKLTQDGIIIVAEHLRNTVNFIAYSIGFFHFFSEQEWKQTFHEANLHVVKESSVTPFIRIFILQKHGTAL